MKFYLPSTLYTKKILVPTSQRTQPVPITKINALALFSQIRVIVVYCKDKVKRMNAICGQNQFISQTTLQVSIRRNNNVILFKQIRAVNCDNEIKHI